jgi:hypothetical protein
MHQRVAHERRAAAVPARIEHFGDRCLASCPRGHRDHQLDTAQPAAGECRSAVQKVWASQVRCRDPELRAGRRRLTPTATMPRPRRCAPAGAPSPRSRRSKDTADVPRSVH